MGRAKPKLVCCCDTVLVEKPCVLSYIAPTEMGWLPRLEHSIPQHPHSTLPRAREPWCCQELNGDLEGHSEPPFRGFRATYCWRMSITATFQALRCIFCSMLITALSAFSRKKMSRHGQDHAFEPVKLRSMLKILEGEAHWRDVPHPCRRSINSAHASNRLGETQVHSESALKQASQG